MILDKFLSSKYYKLGQLIWCIGEVLIQFTLLAIKIFNIVDIPWFWALMPTWGTLVVVLIGFITLVIISSLYKIVVGEQK